MKQTQNQFYGVDSEKAKIAQPGTIFIASDTSILYIYDLDWKPRRVKTTATGGTANVVDSYFVLPSNPAEESIAFVLYSTGTPWLPGSLGGTYYPSGWYMYLSGVWISDSKFIDNQLYQNENLIAINTESISDHLSDLNNPHQVNKSNVGLSNVDNTSDANKPVSTATQTALNAKAALSHLHIKANITDFNESDYATSAQGLLAGTALQPGDDISELFNDEVYLQPSDNVSALTNDAGYLTSNNVTSYRSDADIGTIYSGYLLNTVITIKKCVDGVETFGQNLTNLETDWTNRLSLTYI
tara:strand:- start:2823 stop:3719 length:897 start_codon:yes stop_codon:yes gene_type:complete